MSSSNWVALLPSPCSSNSIAWAWAGRGFLPSWTSIPLLAPSSTAWVRAIVVLLAPCLVGLGIPGWPISDLIPLLVGVSVAPLLVGLGSDLVLLLVILTPIVD